jgi:hypothetical protein
MKKEKVDGATYVQNPMVYVLLGFGQHRPILPFFCPTDLATLKTWRILLVVDLYSDWTNISNSLAATG